MDQKEPRRPMTQDQKRALVILVVIAIVIAVVAIGVATLALSFGLPGWVAIVLAVIAAAALGLFTFANLM